MPSETVPFLTSGYSLRSFLMMSAISDEERLRSSMEPRLMFIEMMYEPLDCMLPQTLSVLAWPKRY